MNKIILTVLLAIWLSPILAAQTGPNVVIIFIDDMGYADPSCFGNPAIETPNIDRLTAEGIKLTNFAQVVQSDNRHRRAKKMLPSPKLAWSSGCSHS